MYRFQAEAGHIVGYEPMIDVFCSVSRSMAGDFVVVATSVCANLATDILHGSMDHSLASRLTVLQRRSTRTALIAFLLNVRMDVFQHLLVNARSHIQHCQNLLVL